MSAQALQEFFVSLGFEVDTSNVDEFEQKAAHLRDGMLKIGTIVTGVAAGIGLFVTEIAGGIDELGDFAELEQVSIEALQEFGYAAQLNGASLDAVKASVASVNKTVGEAVLGIGRGAMTFDKLGMSAKNADGSVKSFDQILGEVSEKMQGMSRQEAIAMAEKLGIDRTLIPLLMKGRGELEKLRAEARAFGVVSEEGAQKAGKLTDSLDRTKFMMGALGKYIAVELMPQVTSVLDGFRNWMVAHQVIIKSGLGAALRVVTSIIGTLWDWTVRVANGFSGLVKWLNSFGATAKIAAGIALILGAAIAFPAVMIGLLIGALFLVADELVNFYEGNNTVLGLILEQYPNAGKAVVTALGAIGAAFVALKWKAIQAWAATIGGALRSAVVSVLAAATISGGILPLIGMYASMAASAISAGAAAAMGWMMAVAPIALVLAAIAAVAYGIYQLWANWDEVTAWIGNAWDAVTKKVFGFIDTVMGAIGKVGQLLGLTDETSSMEVNVSKTAQAASQAPAMQGGAAALQGGAASSPIMAPGGVVGRAGSSVSNASTVTHTTQITAPITIRSTDPAAAAKEVGKEMARLNRQVIRNGQSEVAL